MKFMYNCRKRAAKTHGQPRGCSIESRDHVIAVSNSIRKVCKLTFTAKILVYAPTGISQCQVYTFFTIESCNDARKEIKKPIDRKQRTKTFNLICLPPTKS